MGFSRIRCRSAVDVRPESDGLVVRLRSCAHAPECKPLPRTFASGSLPTSDAIPARCSSVAASHPAKGFGATSTDDLVAASVAGRAADPVEPVGYETQLEPVIAGDDAI